MWEIGSKWDIDREIGMAYQYEMLFIDMVIYHIDVVIMNINVGYCIMIWDMTVSIWSSSISIWDILSLCLPGWRLPPR